MPKYRINTVTEETQTVSVSHRFYRFRFRIFGNSFRLALTIGKISKTIPGNQNYHFRFHPYDFMILVGLLVLNDAVYITVQL